MALNKITDRSWEDSIPPEKPMRFIRTTDGDQNLPAIRAPHPGQWPCTILFCRISNTYL